MNELAHLPPPLLWINTLQYGIVAAANPDPAPASPGDDLPPPADPSADPPADPAAPPPPPPPRPADDSWKDRRIAQLTAQLRQSERQRTAPPTPASDGTPIPPSQIPPLTEAEVETRAEALAAQRLAAQEFERRSTEVVEAGTAAFPDFMDRVNSLKRLRNDASPAEMERYSGFIAATMETGKAHQILHRLGADLNEAARIMDLSPVRQGIELARLADKIAAEESSATGAPRPAAPPGGSGGGGPSHAAIDPTDKDRSDRLSTAEWMKRREAQLAQQRTARR